MKAAIMGYGTIGSGVYEVLDKNCKSVEKKAGEPIEVKYILDLREFPGSPVEKLMFFSAAIRISSVPWAATSALLEVTTCFPASRQRFTNS